MVADDLIWSTRLVGLVRGAGGEAHVSRDGRDAAGGASAAIVDLALRAGDPLVAVRTLAEHGVPVLCVGQHDDPAARKAALAAGAAKVLAYRKLADDGPATVAGWLAAQEGSPR